MAAFEGIGWYRANNDETNHLVEYDWEWDPKVFGSTTAPLYGYGRSPRLADLTMCGEVVRGSARLSLIEPVEVTEGYCPACLLAVARLG